MNAIGKAPAEAATPAEPSGGQTITPWLAVVLAVILLSGALQGISKTFPAHTRGPPVAVATAVNWASAFVIS
jgi:hypothetical protein